jgi:hypothetical protein
MRAQGVGQDRVVFGKQDVHGKSLTINERWGHLQKPQDAVGRRGLRETRSLLSFFFNRFTKH